MILAEMQDWNLGESEKEIAAGLAWYLGCGTDTGQLLMESWPDVLSLFQRTSEAQSQKGTTDLSCYAGTLVGKLFLMARKRGISYKNYSLSCKITCLTYYK